MFSEPDFSATRWCSSTFSPHRCSVEGHDMVAEARHLPPGKYRGERRMQKDAEGGCAGAGQEQLQHLALTNEFMYHRFYWKKPDPIRIPTVFLMG